ncbi:MAG: DUF255 domain-containing protein [Fimbriimonadaceae bacterium]
MQTQPRFTVVTFVLVALTALAVVSKLLAPYIVAPVNRRLANTQATFLQSGAREHVAWYPVSARPFQEARRLDRPILLVVGAPWSRVGRRLDATVFNSVPIQKLLDRNFICVRADAVESPDWMSAFLPVTRAQLSLTGDLQMWLLDSQARLFIPVGVRAQSATYGEAQFTDEILADLGKLQDARNAELSSSAATSQAGQLQAADLARLAATPQNLVPTLSIYRDDLLARATSSPAGGFPVNQRQRLWPDAWLFLLASSGATVASPTIDGLLRSPTRDMLDGGFFFGSRDRLWLQPLYDKVAVLNAEMCLLLAQYSVLGPSPTPYARFAREDFDSLTGEFLNSDRIIRPCRIGDERSNVLRSRHSSFTPREVRSLLDGVERDWAQQYLHLRTGTNPAMTPYVNDFAQLKAPMYDRVVPKLMGFGRPPAFDHQATLATYGCASARLLQAARILDDPIRLQRIHDIAGNLDLFRRGVDVIHQLDSTNRTRPTLVDYLAYADAALEDFLYSSHVATLENGAAVLNRGLNLFAMPSQSAYRMASFDSAHRVVPDSNPPQLCDDTGESANAAAIRLAWMYSQLLSRSSSHADRQLAAALRARATATVTQFADLAVTMGPYTGGYALAAALTADDTFVLCSGPDPVTMANNFAPKSPFRMVAPVAGPVFPELLGKPGYYVSKQGQLTGPLTESAALKLLPPTLFIGG